MALQSNEDGYNFWVQSSQASGVFDAKLDSLSSALDRDHSMNRSYCLEIAERANSIRRFASMLLMARRE